MNLELIVPPGAPGFRVDTVEMPLPSGVRVARPTIMSLTSSVTVLVVQFVLNDEAATAFDALSRETDFLPEIRSDDTGFTSTSPDQTKQKALRALRAELRGRCADWLADQLPGAFASRRLGRAPMPTAELVTTEIAVPFAQGDHGSYIDFADFGYDPFHWESDDMPNWRLVFDRDDDFAVVAARSAEAFDDENFKPHGDDLRWPMAYHAHEYLDRDIALWAASKLLFAFHARLGEIRDHGIQHRRLERASKRLSVVRDEFLRDALDARVVAAELERYADDERRFEWNACDWKTSEDLRREEPERLLGNLRFMMSESAAALTAAETRLRDGLSVDSAVIGARATLRLTWWVLLIGLAALLVALGSLFIALRTTTDTGTPPAPATTTVTVTRPATPTATPRAQPARPRSSP